MRPMPIGVDDFKKVRDQYYFVDKSDFIRKLIDGHSEVTLLTRPRRFGKTLLLSMVEYFFSLDKKDVSAHLFDGLAIAQAGPAYMQHRGAYPVIAMTLKGIQNNTWNDMYGSFTFFMQQEYQRHAYLWQSDVLTESEKAYGKRIMNGQAKPYEYQMSLWQLSQFLQRYTHKAVLIFIDEYDAPLQAAFEFGFYDQAIQFFRLWFNNALKGNQAMDFAVMTGVLRLAKESIFSGLNNLDVCTVLTEKYSDVCGFTTGEVETVLRDAGQEERLPELKEWYDGYHFGSRDIYNPWSVIKYIDAGCKPEPYWMNTSANTILRQLLPLRDARRLAELQGLVEGKRVRSSIEEGIVYTHLWHNDSALYTMLLTTGYLTAVQMVPDMSERYELQIPNKEIQRVFVREILESVAQGVHGDSFYHLMDDLLAGNTEWFEQGLRRILTALASCYDTASGESFYHGLMLGLTALFLGRDYTIESNRESGYGRFDIAIFPRDKQKNGVILEFKVAKELDDLTPKATEALEQIETKHYITTFTERQMLSVWKYGIAFCGKHVKIIGKK